MNSRELANLVGGEHYGKEVKISSFCVDSRRIQAGQVFVALRGKVHDGHDFAKQALEKGAVALLVERRLDLPTTQIVVKDTLSALRSVARFKRERFKGKVVAIAGSAGKTTTKELVAFLLSKTAKVCKTPKNFNSQVGVPLSVASFPEDCDYWVVEVGASALGDVKRLVELIEPHVRVITSIGEEHLESFGCLDHVILGNGEVFYGMKEEDVGVYPAWLRECYSVDKRVLFGQEPFVAENLRLSLEGVSFWVDGVEVFLPVPSLALVENTLCAFAVLHALGLDWKGLAKHLHEFKPIEGRFKTLRVGNLFIIDDAYNANPVSVRKALETLSMLRGFKVAVLGDMLELGEFSEHYHREVGKLCAQLDINLCAFYGEHMRHAYQECKRLKTECYHFDQKEALAEFLKNLREGIVLIKGSRGMRLEEVIDRLSD